MHHIKFGKILSICSQDSDINQGPNLRKMTGNNSNLDLVNIKAYSKFGQILSICSKDIEQKLNSDINQRP